MEKVKLLNIDCSGVVTIEQLADRKKILKCT